MHNDTPPPLGVDLASITQDDTAELAVCHPKTGEPLGPVITLAGPEHDKRRAIRFKAQREARRKLASVRGMNIAKALAQGDPEEEEEQVIDYLVGCTLGWRGMLIGGELLDFAPANVRRVYTDPRLAWLRDQVRDFLDERENFIASSPTP